MFCNFLLLAIFVSIPTCDCHFIYKYRHHQLPECGQTKPIGRPDHRIVGGEDADPDEFPWMVNVRWSGSPAPNKQWCGGAIIYDRWVVTAAHCHRLRYGSDEASTITIAVGSRNVDQGTEYKVERVITHREYESSDNHNDIALLKIAQPINMRNGSAPESVNMICLPDRDADPASNMLIATGWGDLSYRGRQSRILQKVELDLISQQQCADRYSGHREIIESQICTWTRGKDACQADSGGPLIEFVNDRAVLVGLTSYGMTCADEFPGVFTQVSHFIDWMAEQIMDNI